MGNSFPDDHDCIRLHELNGTFPFAELDFVRVILECYFGPMERLARGSNRRYDESYAFSDFPKGGGLFFKEGVPEVFLTLKGSLLDALGGDAVQELCDELFNWFDVDHQNLFKVTHFDLAFDDWHKLIDLESLWLNYAEAYKFGPLGSRERWQDRGYTVNFGRRGRYGSGSMLCVYDKSAESGGVIDAVRYEGRWYAEKAVVAWEILNRNCPSSEEWAIRAGQLVAGVCCFYDDVAEKNISRRPVADFWSKILLRLGKVTVKVRKIKNDDLSDKRQWLADSASAVLWACYEDLRNDQNEPAAREWLFSLLSSGERRCKPSLRRLIRRAAEAREEQETQGEFPF